MKPLVYCIICPPHWTKTPPLGLEFIRKYNENKGITVKILDLNIIFYHLLRMNKKKWLSLNKEFEEDLFNLVKKRYPQVIKNILKKLKDASLIGFSLFRRNKNFTYKFIEEIRRIYPHKKIVIGGPEVLFMKLRGEQLRKDINWVIGEGERSIEKILNCKHNLVVAYEEIENLDEIPFLDFEGFNINYYSQYLPLYTSRGCIKKCFFCTERRLSSRFRQHSSFYVVKQIEFLMKKFRTNYFIFQDSLINANLQWLEQFLTLLVKKGLKIFWEAQMIVRKDFDYSLAKLCKKAGCFNLFIGLESASNKVLSAMNKGFTKEEALNFFSTLKKAELHYEISLIVGYPAEKEKDFQETIQFITHNKRIIPKIAQVNPYIDYLNLEYTPSPQAIKRIDYLLSLLQKEKIPYTKSFINNLFYKNGVY